MKKRILIVAIVSTLLHQRASAQNVGVGIALPNQKLDVNGKLKIGNDNIAPTAGTVRFNEATSDFEGFNGKEWKSLTASFADAPMINNAALVEEQGYSIAVHGDYAVVGAPKSSVGTGTSDIGCVFVFKRVNKQWQYQQQYWYSGDRRFGSSVAINDKYIFVGAPLTGNTTQQGQVSVFKKVNGVFQYFTQFRASSPIDFEQFGTSLSLYGNYLVIGCRGHWNNNTPNAQGSVYIYTVGNDVFTQMQRIGNPENTSGQEFGVSVAIDSGSLAVGASKANNLGNVARGKVYIYKNNGTTYNFSNVLEYASYGADNDNFGYALAMHNNQLFVGCPGLDITPLNNIGAVFSCKKSAGGDYLSSNLLIYTHPFDAPESFFGKSVAIYKNIVLAGSNKAVYQYTYDGSWWRFHKTLSNSLPGVAEIDAFSLAVYETIFGIGDAAFNSLRGRTVLGDGRY